MKKFRLIAITMTLLVFVLTSCDESELSSENEIEGNYIGTIAKIDNLGEIIVGTQKDAIAEITKIGNKTIQVHFNSVGVDTTFMLNYYEDMDRIMVCFTADDFENMYGHMLGEGHINGGMMGDMQNNETEWTHHLNDEHQESDEHFGNFDMQNHTFKYKFELTEGGLTQNMIFQGDMDVL